MQEKTHKKGLLMAMIPAVLGIVLWHVIWRLGVVPAIASFAIVYGMHWFYGKWGGRISRKEFTQLMILASLFVLLAFFITLVFDIRTFYIEMIGGTGGFFSADFWSEVWNEIKHFGYARDLGLTILFTGLAIASLVFDKKRAREERKIESLSKEL